MVNWWETPLGQARLNELEQASAATQKPTQNRQVRSRLSTRQYASARNSRLTADWRINNSSADSELFQSLTVLRGRSRQLVRDSSYAKRARVIVVNNVIGTGIGMQAQVMTSRDELNTRVNDDIEETWEEWCAADSCHTGGRLAFKHFERQAMGQVFDAGECFIRKYYHPFGRSKIPYALELIEAERIADEFASPSLSAQTGNEIRMGVEVDKFYRPVAYFIRERHPSEIRFNSGIGPPNRFERVPADQIIHLAIIDRWPQTRGEPWMHAAARRLSDMDGYSEAEIVRARAQANNAGWIQTPEDATSFGEEQEDGSFEEESEPGIWKRLNPGETVQQPPPTAPNTAFPEFMRAMLREVAAGSGPSYESVSRDYSQSNYSSSRLAVLDDRDLWRFYQSWFICDFRQIVHREWLAQAVLSGAITSIDQTQYALNPRKFQDVLFKPRGWTWVDPTREVAAYKDAVRCGFTTVSDVIAATGGGMDIEDVLNRRKRELQMMKDAGLVFETDPAEFDESGKEQPAESAPPTEPDTPQNAPDDATPNPPPRRVFSFQRK